MPTTSKNTASNTPMETDMQTELTPEIIFATLQYRESRIEQMHDALCDCRPNAYSGAGSYMTGGVIHVYAEFKTEIRSDRRPNWGTRHDGEDFDALCDQVLADIAAYKADMFGTDIERLALSIIRIKHSEGVVTDRALRMDGFTQECITEIHERASALANEMSDGKPFEVEFTGASNEEAA